MKTSELLTHLGNRLEDPSEVNYTAVEKKQALDQASDAVANLIEWKYLTHLETVTSTITFAENETSKSFSDVFGNGNLRPLRDGIQNIYCEQYSNTVAVNKYIDVIPFLDNDSSYFQGTTAVPVAYLNDDKVFISPVNATATANNNTKFKVYYYKLPYKAIKEDISCTDLASKVFTASAGSFSDFSVGQLINIKQSASDKGDFTISAITDTTLTVVGGTLADNGSTLTYTFDSMDNLGSNLDPILLDYAESILWYEDNKVDRASRARDSAITQINILNAR
jgi:hypothetical protein